MPGRQLTSKQAPSILIKTPVVVSSCSPNLVSQMQMQCTLPNQKPTPLLSLLPNLTLNPPLQRLPLIMLQLPLPLLRLIARQTRNRTAHSPTNTITNPLPKIAQLALGFLTLSFGILLLARFAHTLEAQGAAESLFAGADGLVPRAGGAVGVVFRDARGADGEATDVGAGVGDVFAGFGFGFLLRGLVLEVCLS
jgi:hypothetical protein